MHCVLIEGAPISGIDCVHSTILVKGLPLNIKVKSYCDKLYIILYSQIFDLEPINIYDLLEEIEVNENLYIGYGVKLHHLVSKSGREYIGVETYLIDTTNYNYFLLSSPLA